MTIQPSFEVLTLQLQEYDVGSPAHLKESHWRRRDRASIQALQAVSAG